MRDIICSVANIRKVMLNINHPILKYYGGIKNVHFYG